LAPVEWDGRALGVWDRDAAMSLPTISRSRDLLCSAVGALPLTLWTVDFTAADPIETRRPPRPWMQRPDPNRTRQWILAWTVDDLFFYGFAHWWIVTRYATPNDFPASFERIAPGNFHLHDNGEIADITRDSGESLKVPARDVVEFLSPIEGLLSNGYRAISIALQLDDAADRFAGTDVPAGWLQEVTGGEDLSADELGEVAASFTTARRSNTTAAINKYLEYHEAAYDASKMQLVEGRTYQALELARLGNIPPYLVGAPAGTGMTYVNTQTARADLIDFGAMPYLGCIEQTLSGPNVLPGGNFTRLDTNAWLRNPFTDSPPSPNDMQIAFDPNQPVTVPAP
jgi:hypothetical protein